MSVLMLALTFFLVTNPIGNSPTILSLVKEFEFERQKKILFREAIFSLILALFFQFFGEMFLSLLQVKNYALSVTGGVLLILVSLKMIFVSNTKNAVEHLRQEPFIVPIATPLLSGPGLLTIIMLYSAQENNNLKIFFAILIAWIGVIGVLLAAPYMQRILGRRGMTALEQLMGMILSMISMDMIVRGAALFVESLQTGKIS